MKEERRAKVLEGSRSRPGSVHGRDPSAGEDISESEARPFCSKDSLSMLTYPGHVWHVRMGADQTSQLVSAQAVRLNRMK